MVDGSVKTSRVTRIVVLAITALAMITSGCSNNTPQPPASVLSSAQVGGHAIDGAGRRATSASPCPLDGSDLLGGSTDENTGAYERTVGDHHELVLVGAWDRPRGMVQSGYAAVRKGLASPECRTSATLGRAIRGLADSDLAFSSVWRNASKERVSIVRSYTYVAGTLVMVSLQRTDGSDPEVSDLTRLVKKQVALTNSR